MKTVVMDIEIAKTVLRKLYRAGYIGARHTSEDNVPKGFPKHLHKDVDEVLKKLRRKGFIIAKPTSYGTQVSLNPRRIKEIEQIIRET